MCQGPFESEGRVRFEWLESIDWASWWEGWSPALLLHDSQADIPDVLPVTNFMQPGTQTFISTLKSSQHSPRFFLNVDTSSLQIFFPFSRLGVNFVGTRNSLQSILAKYKYVSETEDPTPGSCVASKWLENAFFILILIVLLASSKNLGDNESYDCWDGESKLIARPFWFDSWIQVIRAFKLVLVRGWYMCSNNGAIVAARGQRYAWELRRWFHELLSHWIESLFS